MFPMNRLYYLAYMQLKTEKKMKITTDGDCMRPIVNNMDIVEVSIPEKYHIGDIVLVLVQNRLRLHRIISKDKKGYITKGDHSYMADRRINSKILGRATINNTQKRSLCSSRIRSVFRAKISKFNSKTYRRYLKAHKCFFRNMFFKLYQMGDFLLFHS